MVTDTDRRVKRNGWRGVKYQIIGTVGAVAIVSGSIWTWGWARGEAVWRSEITTSIAASKQNTQAIEELQELKPTVNRMSRNQLTIDGFCEVGDFGPNAAFMRVNLASRAGILYEDVIEHKGTIKVTDLRADSNGESVVIRVDGVFMDPKDTKLFLQMSIKAANKIRTNLLRGPESRHPVRLSPVIVEEHILRDR